MDEAGQVERKTAQLDWIYMNIVQIFLMKHSGDSTYQVTTISLTDIINNFLGKSSNSK